MVAQAAWQAGGGGMPQKAKRPGIWWEPAQQALPVQAAPGMPSLPAFPGMSSPLRPPACVPCLRSNAPVFTQEGGSRLFQQVGGMRHAFSRL